MREVTKLHYRDSTSSNDEFSSYAESIKLISTTSTTHPVNNKNLDSYSEGATLSKFIHEGRPTTTKPTFVALRQVTEQYGSYTASPAKKTTSAIIEVKIDKRLQLQVNQMNIARDTSIKWRPKNSSQNMNFSFLP